MALQSGWRPWQAWARRYHGSMLLNDIVETSRRVGEVSARLAKIDLLAACLKTGTSGRDRHRDRVAVGRPEAGPYRPWLCRLARRDRARPPFSTPLLTLAEVNAVLERVQRVRGSGSGSERQRALATQLYRINWRGSRILDAFGDECGQPLRPRLRKGGGDSWCRSPCWLGRWRCGRARR